ncbi:MAG: hypothetical protein M3P95_09375 [Actinomycetota bacterium]|nr:hypothetical protein [Actinomycetota bacterium]
MSREHLDRRASLEWHVRLHEGDVWAPVDPDGLPARLEAAGFAAAEVEVRGDRFRFNARVRESRG